MYAHDTTLLLNDENLDLLHSNAISELENVHSWIRANKSMLNISKASNIPFQNRPIKNSIPPLLLDGNELNQVTNAKFRSVIATENRNWKHHIDHTC